MGRIAKGFDDAPDRRDRGLVRRPAGIGPWRHGAPFSNSASQPARPTLGPLDRLRAGRRARGRRGRRLRRRDRGSHAEGARAQARVTLVEPDATCTACPFGNNVLADLRRSIRQQFGYDGVARPVSRWHDCR